ncbi:unnamed protein product [Prunus armeniaca]
MWDSGRQSWSCHVPEWARSPPSPLARAFGRGFEFVFGRKTRPYRSVTPLGEGQNPVPSGMTSSEAGVGEFRRSRRSDG